METRANYVLIGAFTLTMMGAIVAFIMWFSGANKGAGRQIIQVTFDSSVSGLSPGSQVLFNGLKVGEVTLIDLVKNNPSQAYALIEVSQRTPVKTNTGARLEYQGLTGVASIALTGGAGDAPNLKGENGNPPTIVAEQSGFQNILETVQRVSGTTQKALAKFDQLISENAGSISETIVNIDRFSDSFANLDSLQNFLPNVAGLGRSMKPFIDNVQTLIADYQLRLSSVDPDAVKNIVVNVKDISAKLNVSADKINGMLAGFNGPSSPNSKGVMSDVAAAATSIRRLAGNFDKRTREITAGVNKLTGPGLKQYQDLAIDAKKTLDEGNKTFRSISKDPQQLIFGAKPKLPEYGGR